MQNKEMQSRRLAVSHKEIRDCGVCFEEFASKDMITESDHLRTFWTCRRCNWGLQHMEVEEWCLRMLHEEHNDK